MPCSRFLVYEKLNYGKNWNQRESSLKTYCQAKILLGTRFLGFATISMSGTDIRDGEAAKLGLFENLQFLL